MYMYFTPLLYLSSEEVTEKHSIIQGTKLYGSTSGQETLVKIFGYWSLEYVLPKLNYTKTVNNDLKVIGTEKLTELAYDFQLNYTEGMWLLKDNCVYNQFSFIFNFDKGNSALHLIEGSFSKANGLKEDTNFSNEELEKAYELSKIINQLKGGKDVDSLQFYENKESRYPLIHKIYNETDKITKCLGYIQLARTNVDMLQKISFYVVAIETLFSNDDLYQVNKKCRNRLSAFLDDSQIDPETIKNNFDIGYNLRSAFLHGGKIGEKYIDFIKDNSKTILISEMLDNYLRMVFNKIIKEQLVNIFRKSDDFKLFFNIE